ncbi:hypothetical protein [Clostridium sp. CCUG 7971]|uniref:hypothetical protein n=1 Tax=Clostridium sp. CCUG 7971 TaxID=2811414 RepID=UPI001ABB29B9|nr:hypothetical protein [Clostridium sp. CCUG 7971]MBO3444365.1 hypothetical protein [Clostridium sp. CCUG 7971]
MNKFYFNIINIIITILPFCIILSVISRDDIDAFGVIALVSASLAIIVRVFAFISNKRQHKDAK